MMFHITRVMHRAITFAVVFAWFITGAYPASAATYCDPQSQYLTSIGMEYIANPAYCIPEGMTDNTILDSYIITSVECRNNTVSYYNAEGDVWDASPASIINPYKNAGYRVFRNKEGSHIVVLQSSYTGLIGGTSAEYDMGNYAGGQVYTGLFKEAFLPPSSAPNCKGGDFNNPPMETCASSTVNMGSGRLSHAQEVFTLGGNPLPLSVTLFYRSVPFAPSSIGNGWSHSYEATLQAGAGYNMVFWIEGKRRIYNRYTSTGPFVPPKGDYSTLVKNADNSWIITELDGLKRNFDSTYKLTSIVDRYNNTLSFNYTDNRLTSVTDANGRSVTFGYNGTTGKLETISDPKLNVHTLGYSGNNLTSVTPPGNKGQWTYTYDPDNGLLETKKDPADNSSSYTYYPSSTLVQKAIDPNLKERNYTYPASLGGSGKIPDYFPISMVSEKTFNFVEKDGNGWIYTFDTNSMNVRTATDPLGKTSAYYYNTDGTLRAKAIPYNGSVKYTTFYAYDGNGNQTGETEPLDLSLPQYAGINPAEVNTDLITATSTPIAWGRNYTYDTPANYYQLKTITDNRGTAPLTTTYDRSTEQNGQLLVTKTTAPGETAGTTLISYQRQNANGTIASITDANSKTTSFAYYPVDAADNTSGMLQTVTTPDNIKLTYSAYDKNGNPTEFKLTDSNNVEIPVKTTQGYDTLNRIASILKESTANPIRFSPNLTTYGYDNSGNLNSLIDPENHETQYEHTFQGQIKKITSTINGLLVDTVLEYGGTGCPSCNGADRLTAVKDPNHVKNNLSGTVYQYDVAGRLEREIDPLNKITRYTYYDNDLLKEKYDATGGAPGTLLVTYLYNNRGQLTEKHYPGNTSVKFTYKPNGWLETAGNYSGTTLTFGYTYEYHYNGRLKSVTDNSGRKISYDLYDPNGQRKRVTVLKGGGADERIINYDYDTANRPWNIKIDSDTKIFTYTYDERGRRDTLDYPDGTTADWDFDDLDRLTGVTHRVTGGSAFATYGYPYHDQVGNITAAIGDRSATYFYDEIYRVLNVVSASSENFTYDDAGNRKSGPGPMDGGPYVYNDANQITTGRKIQYGYDSRGNQDSRTVTGTSGKNWTQTWDNENRLKTVEKTKTMPDGTERKAVNFSYDPFGRRIGKSVENTYYDVATSQYVTKTESYVYVYDAEDIALEIYTPPTGPQEKTYYTHGPGIDEPLAMEREISGASGSSFYYYHADGLGSIVAITNGANGVAQRYEYDAFGMASQTSSFRNSYLWAAREYESETGLYFNRTRYYDPMEGRFISKDTISFAGGDVNLYGYVLNNPVNLIDPDGLCFFGSAGIELLRPFGPIGEMVRPLAEAPTTRARPIVPPDSIPLTIPNEHSKEKCKDKDDSDCDKEWREARQVCRQLIYEQMEQRAGRRKKRCVTGVTGGFTDVEECARGLVSERCGGNKILRGGK